MSGLHCMGITPKGGAHGHPNPTARFHCHTWWRCRLAVSARAQQRAVPVVGLLSSDAPDLLQAFRRGLKDTGYTERENIAIDYRPAQIQIDRGRNKGQLHALVVHCAHPPYVAAWRRYQSVILLPFMNTVSLRARKLSINPCRLPPACLASSGTALAGIYPRRGGVPAQIPRKLDLICSLAASSSGRPE